MSAGEEKTNIRIAVICGGTGGHTVIRGLKKLPQARISAIVNVTDDGKSSGRLRRSAMGSLPPGDARQALHALLNEAHPNAQALHHILTFRFPEEAEGHASGNLIIAALEQLWGLDSALKAFEPYLRGRVIPVTLDSITLAALLEDGTVIEGETNIDVPKHDPHLHIKELQLRPQRGALNPGAREEILHADIINIGPGDHYTSILPNLLMDGMAEALREAKAPKVYVVNVMQKLGETHGFAVHDFVNDTERYIGKGVFTHVLYNTGVPDEARLAPYRAEGADLVRCNEALLPAGYTYLARDVLSDGPFIRHDPDKLAAAILEVLQ